MQKGAFQKIKQADFAGIIGVDDVCRCFSSIFLTTNDEIKNNEDLYSMRLTIATRKSNLALWQAKAVQQLLKDYYPEATVDLLPMVSEGDRLLESSLATLGGKGLFIRALEKMLLEGKADMAVHSLKDMPAVIDERFQLAAFLPREDPSDAWISKEPTPFALTKGIVGTSSLRRKALLLKHTPHLRVEIVRGNVETRLNKLDTGAFDALLLACAGLKRLNLAERITMPLPTKDFIPAPGQGIIAIEILSNRLDLREILKPLDDESARLCALTERAVAAYLGLDCSAPFGAYAKLDGENLLLHAFIATMDGSGMRDVSLQGPSHEPLALAKRCAMALIS